MNIYASPYAATVCGVGRILQWRKGCQTGVASVVRRRRGVESSDEKRAISSGAQRARCAGELSAQRFWGPLEDEKVLRARPMRATRVLRAGRKRSKRIPPVGGIRQIQSWLRRRGKV